MEELERGRLWQLWVPTLLQRTSWMFSNGYLRSWGKGKTESPVLNKQYRDNNAYMVCHTFLSPLKDDKVTGFTINEAT